MATAQPNVRRVNDPFFTYRFHTRSEMIQSPRISGALGERSGIARAFRAPENALSLEAAARFHLERLFAQESETALRTLLAQERPQVVPDLAIHDILDLPQTKTLLVRFRQTYTSIPIFGSNAVVEIETNGELVSVTASLATPPKMSALSTISVEDGLRKIANYAGKRFDGLKKTVPPPVQRLFHRRETDIWHVVYVFSRVPAPPPEILTDLHESKAKEKGQVGLASRAERSTYNYFVDANSGEIVLCYSADPQIASAIPPPTQLNGVDEDGVSQMLDGTAMGPEFELSDPLRNIKTFDLNFQDADPRNLPSNPIRSTSQSIAMAAAVSAHVNATLVWKFYNNVLARRGIDGKGMELTSVVNCLDSSSQPPPEWSNAAWAQGRMWYGQTKDGHGTLRSYSRFLDVIAHELTHGLTEAVAGLVYRNESGALDESISDIFGIIIANQARNSHNVAGWKWEIGAGLGNGGGPLRNFSDPTLTGDPDHMSKYVKTSRDWGGVHTNSNIHNKAAYNLMTTMAGRAAAFPPEEVALLYYLALTRLWQTAKFLDMRDALEDVATTRYAGQAIQQQRILDIRNAYQQVGIV